MRVGFPPLASRGGPPPAANTSFLDKGKELLASLLSPTSLLSNVTALSPQKRHVRQRRGMAPPKEAQNQRREIHGSSQSCDARRQELFTEELQQRKAQRVQGTSQSHQGPNPVAKRRRTYSESCAHYQRVAMCRMWSEQLDDTQGVSPVPQAAPRSLKPDAAQGGGIRVHGEPSTDLGGRSQTRTGQSARKVSIPGWQGPAHFRDPHQGWGNVVSGLTDMRKLLLLSWREAF